MKTQFGALFVVLIVLVLPFVSLTQETQTHQDDEGFPVKIRKAEEIKFKHSSFTFARIKYSSTGIRGRASKRTWMVDYPNADLNLTAQFPKETGLKVDPNGIVLELTAPELFDYPFIYMVEPGQLYFRG